MKTLFAFIILMFVAVPFSYAQDGMEQVQGAESESAEDEKFVPNDDPSKLTILSTHGTNYDGTIDKINHDFTVEIADSSATRSTGLMFRKSMDPDTGMLFLFAEPYERERTFWMKNTFIELDLIFIRKDGTISHIHQSAKPHDETPIPSNGPVFAALEVPSGVVTDLNIKVGDTVHHPAFGNVLAELPPIK